MKQHKMMFEIIRKEATEHGSIDILESVKINNAIGKITKKLGYECYLKGYPKGLNDYNPTNKEYYIKTVEDIAKLNSEQFEMFIEDLRNWTNIQREVDVMKKMGLDISSDKGMIWLDTGKHEAKIDIKVKSSNKI